jgi:magnesium-protoporphyrin IX monomethyl ester (oxidative) cyclase
MRSNPKLISGLNVYWIKFFLLAVFATMYVRDHCRPAFHKAIGMDPTDYDFAVFRLTSEISRQTFPLTLDLDNPAFKRGLERLCRVARSIEEAQARGGLGGKLRRAWLAGTAALAFGGLYMLPSKANPLPADIRLAPAW